MIDQMRTISTTGPFTDPDPNSRPYLFVLTDARGDGMIVASLGAQSSRNGAVPASQRYIRP
jgi:hypothetical protein